MKEYFSIKPRTMRADRHFLTVAPTMAADGTSATWVNTGDRWATGELTAATHHCERDREFAREHLAESAMVALPEDSRRAVRAVSEDSMPEGFVEAASTGEADFTVAGAVGARATFGSPLHLRRS
jgi:hypothetical protein